MFDQINDLLGVVLWPALVALFLLYFRNPISTIIGSIGDSIKKSERGSVGVGNFKLDWGKAEEEMISAAEKSEQSASVRGTGDGTIGAPAGDIAAPTPPRAPDSEFELGDILDDMDAGDDGDEAGEEPAGTLGHGSGTGTGAGYGLNPPRSSRPSRSDDAEDEENPPPATPSAPMPGDLSMVGSMPSISDIVQKAGWRPVRISRSARESALQRAQRSAQRLDGLRILWLDDNPQQNTEERRMFRTMDIQVTAVEDHDEAMRSLARGDYDIVISDMRRGEDQRAGMKFLEEMRSQGFQAPVIFYVGHLDPSMGVPPFAFGITNRPDELLHMIVEIAERRH